MNFRTFKPLAGPALLLAVLALAALLTRPLLPIDETRYVGVAWEMWHTGDHLVMFKNGEPYSHKPPLLFWLYNLGWALFGVHAWWPRLVSPLFSLGGLWLTGSLARRLWPDDRHVGRTALWILASSLMWMVFSTTVMFDVMLAFFVLLGLRGLLLAAGGSATLGFLWYGVAIGLGVLGKGPVMLLHLLPVALSAPWWCPGMNWRRWYGGIALAVLGGAVIALAWAVPAALRGGEEYRNAIFWGQTAHRMVESFAHKRPFWWYVPMLPLMLFPWLVWPPLWRQLAAFGPAGPDRGLRFCITWTIPVFVAFSAISGKQLHYLLPLFPAFALMAGRVLSRTERATIWLPALLSGLLGAVMVYFSLTGLPGKARQWDGVPAWPGVVLMLMSLSAALIARRPQGWLPSLAVLNGASFFLVQFYVAHNVWAHYDVTPMADAIRRLQDGGVVVATIGRYHDQYQFAGRLRQPVVELAAGRVPAWLDENPGGALLVEVKSADLAASGGTDCLFKQPYRGRVALLLSVAQAQSSPVLLRGGTGNSAQDADQGSFD